MSGAQEAKGIHNKIELAELVKQSQYWWPLLMFNEFLLIVFCEGSK